MPGFELYPCDDGTMTLVDTRVGQAMHSRVGPYPEATLLYTGQSQLADRLQREDPRPLVILDIGMGIGANAIAAIDVFLSLQSLRHLMPKRKLRIVSFEDKPEGLELALRRADQFPFLHARQEAARAILDRSAWSSPQGEVHWELRAGDFRDQDLSGLEPELIYFDFFSPQATPELWTKAVFAKLFAQRRAQSPGTTLLTYTAATSARSALLLAGFQVGRGVGTEAKKETTVASNFIENLVQPLDAAWLEKFRRSDRRLPIDAEAEDFERVISGFRLPIKY